MTEKLSLLEWVRRYGWIGSAALRRAAQEHYRFFGALDRAVLRTGEPAERLVKIALRVSARGKESGTEVLERIGR